MSADIRSIKASLAAASSGLEGDSLHSSVWRAFRQARDGVGLAVGPEQLHDVNDSLADRFVAAVRLAVAEIETSAEVEGKTWSGTARGMAAVLYGDDHPVTPAQLATLEAAVRHAANVLDYCGVEDGVLADLEGEWRTWAPRRCGMDDPAPTQLAGDGDADPDSGD